ncbi:MAG: response regulator transcription factor [Gammaproteobacteria bacterium]|jgi:two-component system phosphate regulon response regulator PhoB
MSNNTILVVEDEEDIRELLVYNLNREDFSAVAVESGELGLEYASREHPDMVILDLMLPGMDGLAVCRQLKNDKATRDIPIIIASAKGEEADIVAGLELGADDYIAKPFSPKVLIARVRALLRRSQQPPADAGSTIKIHDFVIEPNKFKITIAGKKLDVTANDFKILHFLASHAGWVFTRYQIVNAVRGEDYVVTERAIDVQIAGLRKKLGKYAEYIETVRGIGYRFRE